MQEKEDADIHSLVDKIYCINLEKRQDRWRECEGRFRKYNLNVCRVKAVEGKLIEPPSIYIKPGELGCLLSHIIILEDIVKNNYSYALIFEDDFELVLDWKQKLFRSIGSLPDGFDMLYLGCKHISEPSVINDSLYKVNAGYTSSAYIISKDFAQLILPVLKELKKPVDVYFKELQPYHNIYAVKPCISWQWANHSDIQDEYSDTKLYFKRY